MEATVEKIKKTITLVVPMRNESKGIKHLMVALKEFENELQKMKLKLEVIVVDNHSMDNSLELIRQTKNTLNIHLYRLSRNYGLQRSILFGISKATGDAAVVLQSDLQDPPEVALQMIVEWQNGSKFVAATSIKRDEPYFNRLSSGVFYYLINLLSETKMLRWFQDFFLLDKTIYSDLIKRMGYYEFLRGRLVDEYNIDSIIKYRRNSRINGKSNYRFASRYNVALDGVTRYATKFIRRLLILSLFSLMISSFIFSVNLIVFMIYGTRIFGNIVPIGTFTLLSLCAFSLSLVLEYQHRILRLVSEGTTSLQYKIVK